MSTDTLFQRMRIRWFILISLLGLILNIIGIDILLHFNIIDEATGDVVGGYLFYLIPCMYLLVIFTKYQVSLHRFVWVRVEPFRFMWWQIAGIVMALLLFSMGAVTLTFIPVSYIFPDFVLSILEEDVGHYTSSDTGHPMLLNTLEIISVIALAPIVEEIIFRGVLLHRFSYKWGLKAGIIISSIIFGFGHTDVIGGFVFGLVMCLLYLKTNSLILPILCHVLNNSLVTVWMYAFYMFEIEETATIEGLRADLWSGVSFVLVSLPLIVYFMYKNWPSKDRLYTDSINLTMN